MYGMDWHTDEPTWKKFEIKTEDGELTDTEIAFQQDHPGAVTTVRSLEDGLLVYGRVLIP